MTTSEPNLNDDLHWLAFRYVCGELAADEEAAFERRLADDQAAREAVAEAVELQQAIRVAAAQPGGRQNRAGPRRRLVWGAAAASVFLAVGVWWLASGHIPFRADRPPQQPGQNVVQGGPAAARDVALTWAEMQRQPPGDDVAGAAAEPSLVVEDELPIDEALGNDGAVPHWMVIALSDEVKRTKGKR